MFSLCDSRFTIINSAIFEAYPRAKPDDKNRSSTTICRAWSCFLLCTGGPSELESFKIKKPERNGVALPGLSPESLGDVAIQYPECILNQRLNPLVPSAEMISNDSTGPSGCNCSLQRRGNFSRLTRDPSIKVPLELARSSTHHSSSIENTRAW